MQMAIKSLSIRQKSAFQAWKREWDHKQLEHAIHNWIELWFTGLDIFAGNKFQHCSAASQHTLAYYWGEFGLFSASCSMLTLCRMFYSSDVMPITSFVHAGIWKYLCRCRDVFFSYLAAYLGGGGFMVRESKRGWNIQSVDYNCYSGGSITS